MAVNQRDVYILPHPFGNNHGQPHPHIGKKELSCQNAPDDIVIWRRYRQAKDQYDENCSVQRANAEHRRSYIRL